ncbi:MAG: 2-C-methyl-D-erythritol 2,4-cyclodiphosphate synthase [Candidatus Omnitrophica bacterium]|nr:2-C-methyl-D-erythritol 2,4-cyclodiphosphate synthase [Candidatus Omnitrophota bacterium]
MRTGLGFDIHRFEEGRKFILGGVEIPFEKGLLGHSDGDVLLHAFSDALLGAMGKPDIGSFFPDTEDSIKGIDSRKILAKVLELLEKEEFYIENVDITVICERPKLLPFFPEVKKSLSGMMDGIDGTRIGLKAKTFEGIGEIGAGKACACIVSVLIEEKS